MKRRIFIVLSMSLLVFSLIGCDLLSNLLAQFDVTLPFTLPTGPVTTVDPDPAVSDRITAPTKLVLVDGTLSWTPVAGVTSYDIFADGVLLNSVAEVSYPVGVPVTRTIYTVVAKGPAGMLDSLPSVGVAFVPDAATEIALIDAAIATRGFPEGIPGFSAELVRRGMPAAEFDAMLEGISLEFEELDVAALSEAVDRILVLAATVIHREALIAAVIHIMPEQFLEPQLTAIEAMIESYTDLRDRTWNPSDRVMYDQIIRELQTRQAELLELQEMIEVDPDLVIASLTRLVDYLVEVLGGLDGGALDGLIALLEAGDADVAELLLVKNEMVQVLLDTIPEIDDFVLLYRTLLAFANPTDLAGAELLANEAAVRARYELELSLRFLLASEALFEELLSPHLMTVPEGDLLGPSRMIRAFAIDYLSFKAENADLIAAADAALDDATDYLLFRQAVRLSNTMLENAGTPQGDIDAMNVFYDAITPELFVKIEDTDELIVDRMMTYFAENAENAIYLKAVLRGIGYDGETFYNHATGETFDTVTEYDRAYLLASYAYKAELFRMIDEIAGSLSVDEAADLIDVLKVVFPMFLTDLDAINFDTAADADAILLAFATALDAEGTQAVAMLQRIAAYVVDNDVYGGIATIYAEADAYWTDLYGADYDAIEGMDRSYGRYRYMVYFAHHYDALLTPDMIAFLDAASIAYFDLMRAGMLPGSDLDDDYWDERQELFDDRLLVVIAGARACGDLDPDLLTEVDKDTLDDMFATLFGLGTFHDDLI
ncbi:MAG TPA: hypothetical protein DCR44_02085 [Acholeplasmatales bacterium]|nr:MAG: hypothetical protein A2Y16_03675 [Tenericutes bacterium GWF2_57_13]HAQ56181.1 hypothetical protein [Acholeplasmatales bacterium]